MIVADVNLIAYLWITGQHTVAAGAVLTSDRQVVAAFSGTAVSPGDFLR